MSSSTIRATEAMLSEYSEPTIAARNAIWEVLMPSEPLVEKRLPATYEEYVGMSYTEAEVDAQATKAVCVNQDLAEVLERVQNWRIHAQSADTVTIRVDALRALMSAWTQHSYSEYEQMDKNTQKLYHRVMDAEKRAKTAEDRAEAAEAAVAELRERAEAAEERATDAEQHIKAEEERFSEMWLDWADKEEHQKWEKSVLKRRAEKMGEHAASLERNLITLGKRHETLESLRGNLNTVHDKWNIALNKKVEAEATLAGLRTMGLDETAESMRVATVLYKDASAEEKTALETYTDAKNLLTLLNPLLNC